MSITENWTSEDWRMDLFPPYVLWEGINVTSHLVSPAEGLRISIFDDRCHVLMFPRKSVRAGFLHS